MPREEHEIRVVTKSPAEGEAPPGLRVLKTVKSPKSDLYVFPLPGAFPPGSKLSIHASGAIIAKTSRYGVVARADLSDVIQRLQSPTFDEAIATLLAPPKAGKSAKGVIVRPEAFPGLAPLTGGKPGDVELDLVGLTDSLTQLRIRNTTNLAGHLAWMRSKGLLPERGMLLLDIGWLRRRTVFLNLQGEKPFPRVPISLPESMPLRRTLGAVLSQLVDYGGIFIALPSERGERKLARILGLGEVYDWFVDELEEVDKEDLQNVAEGWMRDIELALTETTKSKLTGPPLRPGLVEAPSSSETAPGNP